MFFRAQRYRAKDFLESAPAALLSDDRAYRVHDISMSGVSVLAPACDALGDVGEQIHVDLTLGGQVLYSGRGRIVRAEPTARGAKLGLHLRDGHLDIGRLTEARDEIWVRNQLDNGYLARGLHVAPEYRKVCADTIYMLRHYRAIVDSCERQVERRNGADSRLDEIYATCEERFLAEWRALRREGHQITQPVLSDMTAVQVVKQFTETVLTPEFLDGPIWRRSYEKPLGYPGDYQVMNYVYDGDPEGESAFARLLHKIGVDVGYCVRTRMETIRAAISETVADEAYGDQPIEVLSIGCGPAREVTDYLAAGAPPRRVRFTLVDQSREALGFAYESAYPRISKLGGHAAIRCLHVSFGQLLTNPQLFESLRSQHLIYCAGLFDYLSDAQCRGLLGALYGKLVPGGRMVVGNMKAGTDNVWPLGFILDWRLIYRTRDEMLAMAAAIEPAAVEVTTDPTGYAYLLDLRKGA